MVVVEPVVAEGHDLPSLGSSEIQHDVSASSVAARVDRAVDHLGRVPVAAALALGESERHHHGIQRCANLARHHVARLIAGGGHVVMMADQDRSRRPQLRPKERARATRQPAVQQSGLAERRNTA
jgi:hypothetical protein